METDKRKPKAKVEITDLIPADVNPNPDLALSENLLQNGSAFVGLTQRQILILVALVENVISENPVSDAQIAAQIGVHRTTITRNRQNPQFSRALSVMVREIVKGDVDSLIGQLYKHGQKNYKAIELLLKYSGQYTEKHQSFTVHANVDTETIFQSSGDAIDAFLIRLGELGWNSVRLAARFQVLGETE